MGYSSQLTRERILKSVRQEFMKHGYQGANMRRIAEAAKVTTGATYNHFTNKALLFDALVQAPAEEMLGRFEALHQRMAENVGSLSRGGMAQNAQDGTYWMPGLYLRAFGRV